MGREEAVASAAFKDMQALRDHELVMKRADASDCVLDQVGELVAEGEGQQGAAQDHESALPSKLPDKQGYDCRIHRCPDELVREEGPDRVCYK